MLNAEAAVSAVNAAKVAWNNGRGEWATCGVCRSHFVHTPAAKTNCRNGKVYCWSPKKER